jgi:putative hemolysin
MIVWYLSLISLIGSGVLAAMMAAIHSKGKLSAEEELSYNHPSFFFRNFLLAFGKKLQWEGLLFSLHMARHLLLLCYALTGWIVLAENLLPGQPLISLGLLFLLFLLVDFASTLLGKAKPSFSFNALSVFASCLLLLSLPLVLPLFRLMKYLLPIPLFAKKPPPFGFKIRDKVYKLLQETELGAYLDSTQQKLILAVVSFKDKIAREVMVPRINVFSLSDDTPLGTAAHQFLLEGYSRIPVYKESVDNIIGVLLHKDVLQLYVENVNSPQNLDTTIRKLVKPVLYTPETKKISQLLQEFRNKQIHLAIVVDEWGGTEGIVTIEDILEELVGEIADEYDTGQESLFVPLPDGSWVVDAKMSIIDIQEELGINIPESPEYDTIGGYAFNKAGAIPSKGWKIHHDAFDLEVLSSSERAINKIRITALLA